MKNLGVIVTIIIAVGTGLISYGGLKNSQAETRKKVEAVEKQVDTATNRIHANDMIDVRQSVLLEGSLKIIEKLEQKL